MDKDEAIYVKKDHVQRGFALISTNAFAVKQRSFERLDRIKTKRYR